MDEHVASVRRFNRFYTRQAGLLARGFLASPFSLAEVRILYELSASERVTAAELGRQLGMDAGYLSRILGGFQRKRLLTRESSPDDARRALLRLSARGRRLFATLDARQVDHVKAMLAGLPAGEAARLVGSMRTIEELLGERDRDRSFVLRPPRPGDMGWIVHRHGQLYSEEYGWDERFEALVARIAADFVERYDARWERCWIAEQGRAVCGSVFCVRKSAQVAQLRMLYVEPAARGLGIGARLVEECVAFARGAGYRRMFLWTNARLHAARHLYERAGFSLTGEESEHRFGHDQVSQTWEMSLRA